LPAPYSKKNLVDANDRYFNLQPYRGGWIVTSNGVHMGFVKKTAKGWTLDHAFSRGAEEALARAARLLDAHSNESKV
jgi:hypothetical protein